MGERRRKLIRLVPLVLIIGVVGLSTAVMITDSDDDSSVNTALPSSVANPHPGAGGFVADDTELSDCGEQRCFEQAFGNLVFRNGPSEAFEVFDREIAAGGPIATGCHRIAHYMGGAGLARYDGDVGRAFSEGSSSCWSGYYHGILEWALQVVSDKQLAGVVRELCDEVRDDGTFLLYQCVHGLGHGLMINGGYDLPRALADCSKLRADWDQNSCWGGVFMENIATGEGSPIEVTGEPEWLDRDDLLFPCNDDDAVRPEAKDECYVMVTSRILQANGRDFADAASWCRDAEAEWIGTCFQSLGRDASGSTTYDPQATAELCRHAEEYIHHCIWAAARDFTLRHAGTDEATELCLTVRRRFREGCFNGIGTIVATLEAEPEARIATCMTLSERYGPSCVEGAEVSAPPVQVPN